MWPSFSRQIQLLETEIGAKLMSRSKRSVALTEAGEVFRDEFTKILLNIEQATNLKFYFLFWSKKEGFCIRNAHFIQKAVSRITGSLCCVIAIFMTGCRSSRCVQTGQPFLAAGS